MYVDFETLPQDARIWIYQSDCSMSKDQQETLKEKAKSFISKWKRHGDDLKGSFLIKYNYFFILAVDESFCKISGCSIDASVNFIKEMEHILGIKLTNRINISYKNKSEVLLLPMHLFKDAIRKGELSSDVIVFNNLVQNKKEFEKKWEVPISHSWHIRFLNDKV